MAYEVSSFTGYLIRRAQQAHVAVWQREVSTEISSPQFGVLSVLNQSPGQSQAKLCEELDLDRSTIADIVQRLDRRGLIERNRHQADRRRNVLYLTPMGLAEYERLLPRVGTLDHVLTSRLSDSEAAELRRLLAAVLDHD
jgi:DNA-binding MarR family transcriptional regulator